MERYFFLDLYIRLARIFAAVVAVLGLIQAFRVIGVDFWWFLQVVLVTAGMAFMILVGADMLACFRDIEGNTRKTPPAS